MHGFQAIAHFVSQIGSLVVAGLGFGFGVHLWTSEARLGFFGRCHATPLARTCDALLWAPRQFKKGRPLRFISAIVHLVITAFFPVAAVVFTNGAAVEEHPVAFGLAGVIAAVIAEAPEAFARNAQYRSYASATKEQVGVKRRCWKHLRGLAPDQKVATVALPVAIVEAAIGVGLYYLQAATSILGTALSAAVLGVAFVAWAEFMSVISTVSLVYRRGSPFTV
jgi:hypothetical protein